MNLDLRRELSMTLVETFSSVWMELNKGLENHKSKTGLKLKMLC